MKQFIFLFILQLGLSMSLCFAEQNDSSGEVCRLPDQSRVGDLVEDFDSDEQPLELVANAACTDLSPRNRARNYQRAIRDRLAAVRSRIVDLKSDLANAYQGQVVAGTSQDRGLVKSVLFILLKKIPGLDVALDGIEALNQHYGSLSPSSSTPNTLDKLSVLTRKITRAIDTEIANAGEVSFLQRLTQKFASGHLTCEHYDDLKSRPTQVVDQIGTDYVRTVADKIQIRDPDYHRRQASGRFKVTIDIQQNDDDRISAPVVMTGKNLRFHSFGSSVVICEMSRDPRFSNRPISGLGFPIEIVWNYSNHGPTHNRRTYYETVSRDGRQVLHGRANPIGAHNLVRSAPGYSSMRRQLDNYRPFVVGLTLSEISSGCDN